MAGRTSAARRLDLVFRALGDQTRRAVLARLRTGPAKITDLAGLFDISLPAVSRHIRVLESAGLVDRSIAGRVHTCSLSIDPFLSIEEWLRQYWQFWEGNLDSLARYVAGEKKRSRKS